MMHTIHDFKEVSGKIVESVTLTNEADFRELCIRFTDRTAMLFSLLPRIEVEPRLVDLSTGSGMTLTEYQNVAETTR